MTDAVTQALKPCPFCDCDPGQPRHDDEFGAYFIRCPRCEAAMPDDDLHDLIDAWNTRAEPRASPPAGDVTPTQAEKPRYLLMKRDLYYGPNNCGYTGIKDKAGRYFETDALPDCGVTAIHEDEAPEFTKACFDDLARDHLQEKVATQAAEIARLREAMGTAEHILLHCPDKQGRALDALQTALNQAQPTDQTGAQS